MNVFLPNVDAFKPGDLMLTYNAEGSCAKDRAMSRAIRSVSRGNFDHVLICGVPPTFIEAVPDGVTSLSMQRCFAHSLDHVRVLRHQDAWLAMQAAARAETHVGRGYSKRKAAASVFPESLIGAIRDKGIFCSALVAQVYAEVGAPEFLRHPIDKTTPATIERLQGLADVTDQAFRSASSSLDLEQFTALDGDRKLSPSSRLTALFQGFASALAPMADDVARRFPAAALKAPETFPDVFDFIIAAIDAEGRIDPRDHVAFREAVSALDAAAAVLLLDGRVQGVMDEMLASDQHSLERLLRRSFEPKPDIDLVDLSNLLQVTLKQIAFRASLLRSLETWGPGRSRTVDGEIEIAGRAIQAFEQRAVVLREVLSRLRSG